MDTHMPAFNILIPDQGWTNMVSATILHVTNGAGALVGQPLRHLAYLDWHILSHKKGSRSASDINYIQFVRRCWGGGCWEDQLPPLLCFKGDRAPYYYMYYCSTYRGVISSSNAFSRWMTSIGYKCRTNKLYVYGHEYSSLWLLVTDYFPCRDWQATVVQCGDIFQWDRPSEVPETKATNELAAKIWGWIRVDLVYFRVWLFRTTRGSRTLKIWTLYLRSFIQRFWGSGTKITLIYSLRCKARFAFWIQRRNAKMP